ncbi:TIGR02678 family protein [Peribacillus deserti]|uniref:TIGR02678 family protein n=1 Tax=Peribacillus deserti TaxID=673318 RepID=A0A2N5M5J5_9BACI|nr:TIGR02678 family protein [Peribacillus deserti]PLT29627.1 TIGR02678 family protein [Peribacillus deserti]
MEQNLFDDKAKQGLQLLFDHYWILRNEKPEWYQLIREREKVLRRYIDEKFGLRLIIHRHFAKLEKIPVEPESWMGIQHFQEPLDYAIFCCALAFLESKAVDEQFLLSEFCEEIRAEFPGELSLDWTLYANRKSLVRAVQVLIDFKLMKQIDGDVNKFDNNQEEEALYQVTTYSRYFMRSYPEDLFNYEEWNQILNEEWEMQTDDERRKRVYRKLFMSPAVYRNDSNDPDFLYIRNFRNRINDDIEKHTNYHFSLYKNTAMLTVPEPKAYHTLFPNQKASSDLVLQLSAFIHEHIAVYPRNEWGEVILTEEGFDQILLEMKERLSLGWAKLYREGTLQSVRKELLSVLEDWLMAEYEASMGIITLKPLLGLLTGVYPQDFREGVVNNGDK